MRTLPVYPRGQQLNNMADTCQIICHWTGAELSQNKTLKGRIQTFITEITIKQAVPFLRYSLFPGIIRKVNYTINSSRLKRIQNRDAGLFGDIFHCVLART